MHIVFRKANRVDVPEIVRLLTEDELGLSGEQYNKNYESIPNLYYAAFDINNY